MGPTTAGPAAIVDQVRTVDRVLVAAIALACAALLAAKFAMVPRLNLNWDEFYFLTHVHAQARGELAAGLQTAYVHLFGWLPGIAGQEVGQLRAVRFVMVALLALSAWLLFRLARRWFTAPAAAFATLGFLTLLPTLRHGGAFRADSMLLPLELLALLALTHPRLASRTRSIVAGALCGAAAAITLKAALLAPVVVALAALRGPAAPGATGDANPRRTLEALAWLAAAAALVAGLLLGLHLATLDPATGAAAPTAAGSAWRRTIGAAQFAPRGDTWLRLVAADPGWWLLTALGAAWCAARRRWAPLSLALALLPILFYGNAYAYHYVPMCAPAAVLLAAAWEAMQASLRRLAPARTAHWVTAGVALAFAAHGLLRANALLEPRQAAQAAVIEAVHRVFPRPVAYFDHSGMIASFPKAGFFMSSWGMAEYRAADRGFVAEALARRQPPLLLANRGAIVPGSAEFESGLLPADRALLERSYLPWWGPIYVAGARVALRGAEPSEVELPFGGRYRLRAPAAVEVDGRILQPGEVVTVAPARTRLSLRQAAPATGVLEVRLEWAAARSVAALPLPQQRIYDPLLPAD